MVVGVTEVVIGAAVAAAAGGAGGGLYLHHKSSASSPSVSLLREIRPPRTSCIDDEVAKCWEREVSTGLSPQSLPQMLNIIMDKLERQLNTEDDTSHLREELQRLARESSPTAPGKSMCARVVFSSGMVLILVKMNTNWQLDVGFMVNSSRRACDDATQRLVAWRMMSDAVANQFPPCKNARSVPSVSLMEIRRPPQGSQSNDQVTKFWEREVSSGLPPQNLPGVLNVIMDKLEKQLSTEDHIAYLREELQRLARESAPSAPGYYMCARVTFTSGMALILVKMNSNRQLDVGFMVNSSHQACDDASQQLLAWQMMNGTPHAIHRQVFATSPAHASPQWSLF